MTDEQIRKELSELLDQAIHLTKTCQISYEASFAAVLGGVS